MQLPFSDLFTNILGIQSLSSFGAKQSEPSLYGHSNGGVAREDLDCTEFLREIPWIKNEGTDSPIVSNSVAFVRDNLAVLPEHWESGGVISSWLNAKHTDGNFVGCMQEIKQTPFIAFDEDFGRFLGGLPKFEVAHKFPPEESQSVHEAPVYVSDTDELVFADTSVVGWLYALDISTFNMRRLETIPPLPNVNGGTRSGNRMYLTTNGSPTPAVWNCSLPTQGGKQNTDAKETVTCTPVVNNYRLAHLNAPNDLIFTSHKHILFTDPNYGWYQSWPGVGPPELATAIYHFNTTSRALIALSNNDVLEPNGLALSKDEKTLYIADSNSTSGKPVAVWESSVRNVYAFDFDAAIPRMSNRRLVHVAERGWPDGIRISKNGLLLVAIKGGVDVVDVERGGVLLGKINVGDDILFNLEPMGDESVWFLTGKSAIYKVTLQV